MNNEIIIKVKNHETEEIFNIIGLDNFINFLNDNDDIFTFCLQKINPITNKMEY